QAEQVGIGQGVGHGDIGDAIRVDEEALAATELDLGFGQLDRLDEAEDSTRGPDELAVGPRPLQDRQRMASDGEPESETRRAGSLQIPEDGGAVTLGGAGLGEKRLVYPLEDLERS